MPTSMTPEEARVIVIAERVSSVFSVVGAVFIIGTFLSDPRFRKPINRLVFYASWGNLFANVATLISRSGIESGVTSPLCQFQAFLIQWFMPADALWTFAMACNVFLTFFRQYDAAALRTLEWRYLVFCYGIPLIPALTFCFIETANKGKFYGSADLWCWVSSEWTVFRIATFYGPVWIIIIFNVFIYVKVGTIVLKWRKQLLSMNRMGGSSVARNSTAVTVSVPMGEMRSPTNTKTYEFSVVSQVPHHDPSRSKHLSLTSPTTLGPTHQRYPSTNTTTIDDRDNVYRRTTIVHPTVPNTHRIVDANRATISYCYTALLFFIALLVTWVPSSVNRVYTLASPGSPSPFALDFASGLVLPLQGFWNTIIYIVTSFGACKALTRDLLDPFSRRPPSSLSPSGKSGLPPNLKRHATQLGSTDISDRERNSDHSRNMTYDTPRPPPRSARESELYDRDSSGKPPADVLISFDGKKRVVHHDYRSSVTENQYDPYNKQQQYEYKQEQERERERERQEQWERSSQDEDAGKTKFYGRMSGSRTSLGQDSSDEEEENVKFRGGADSRVAFAG